MNILAIDQGTSSTKALVVGPDGAVLGVGQASVAPRAREGGAIEQDPSELLDSVLSAGRAATEAALEPIEAIGISNQGETVLCWDPRTGTPLGPAMSWQDRRATVVTGELVHHADRLAELTGLPLDPYFAAPKMTWLRRAAGAGGVATTIDAWVTHQLTGAFVTDVTTASRTMLLDLERREWSDEACRIFAVEPAEQPSVVDCDAVIGETTAFGGRLPVSGLVVDQQGALFAERCFAAGEAKCTYGTGAFILANAGTVVPRSTARLAASVAWSVRSTTTYCLDGQIYSAGAAVSWLERVGLIAGASEIDRVCGDVAPGADAPMFVPALAGLGAPYWVPTARGGWVGLSLAASADDLVRGVVWGIAAHVAALAGAVGRDLGRPIERLRVDGGLARSDALMQAQADLAQVSVERYPSADATALGVGALARIGIGDAASPEDAVGSWSPTAVFEPRMSADEATERLARFDTVVRALVELGASDR